ncbi:MULTISPECIES: ribosomal protection-like ABC-F family protein [unclassified Exiguobacterium]|uniref:ribosomal protection-like ABC-F family protein n=1 Tax=unclassified Exiguobacterium TaxID=2644629 RepID=UPI0004514E64|nr:MULTISPECIES: ABC-F type ribosomal protection protein [unclassified Exiguobacterium]EZP61842.1 ABC transporter ATP-binding protein [Exiguobacterium sp. RIT341]
MMICDIQHLTKQFGGETILTDVSLFLNEHDRVGLIGRNGSGKTTLLRLLARLDQPDGGVIYQKNGLTIGYLEQLPTYAETMTGLDVLWTAFEEILAIRSRMQQLELLMATAPDDLDALLVRYAEATNAFEQKDGYLLDSKIERMVNGLHLRPLLTRPFHQLSGGEQTKICLGRMLLMEPHLLILDEPTNHLDLAAVEWLEQFLRDYTGTILLVSHDRVFLDAVVTSIVELEDGELTSYLGNYSAFVVERERRLMEQFHAYQEQQKKIKKMKEAIRRLRQWANEASPPSEKLFRKAKSMERALERIERIKRPQLEAKTADVSFSSTDHTSQVVFRAEELSFAYDSRRIFDVVSFEIMAQDRVAIVGTNGSGKSTLLALLLDELSPDAGTLTRGPSNRIGYLSQHAHFEEDARLIDWFRDRIAVPEAEARHILARFLFFGPTVFRSILSLSGGERVRLQLAVLVHSSINVLILDEPTNHLDIESRETLEEALENFSGTLIAVSHDRYFLNRLFSKIIWLDHQITSYTGNYAYAVEKRHASHDTPPQINHEKKSKISKRSKAPAKEQSIEQQIEELELQVVHLDAVLSHVSAEEEWMTVEMEKEALLRKIEGLYERLILET